MRTIEIKLMPNGNLRGFQANTSSKNGCSELQITDIRNICPTVVSTTPPKIIIYDTAEDTASYEDGVY